ncbi:MAG: TraR/DksA C4-type zinc finger protein [Gaiellales bacterium]
MTIDLERRKSELEAMRSRILGAAHELVEADASEAELSSSAGDQHLADHASDVLARELDGTLEDNAEEVVAEIDAALGRIASGTYGLCARCGGAIPEARLDAVPYATLCLDCRRLEERGA